MRRVENLGRCEAENVGNSVQLMVLIGGLGRLPWGPLIGVPLRITITQSLLFSGILSESKPLNAPNHQINPWHILGDRLIPLAPLSLVGFYM